MLAYLTDLPQSEIIIGWFWFGFVEVFFRGRVEEYQVQLLVGLTYRRNSLARHRSCRT